MALFSLQVSLFRSEKRTRAAVHRTIVSHPVEQDNLRRASLAKDDFIEGTCASFIFMEARGKVTLTLTDKNSNTAEYVINSGVFTLPAGGTFKVTRVDEGSPVEVTVAHD